VRDAGEEGPPSSLPPVATKTEAATSRTARELYLWGRYLWSQRTKESLYKSLDLFQDAIDRDPDYALANAGVADSYNLIGSYYYLPPREAFSKAKAAAQKALQIDDRVAESHSALGWALLHEDWDWQGAEAHFRKAIELDPNYATAHQWYAWLLLLTGRTRQAEAELRRASELGPRSLAIQKDIGLHHYYSRRFDEAIRRFLEILGADPASATVRHYLASAYLHNRMFRESLQVAEETLGLQEEAPGILRDRRGELLALKEAYESAGPRGYWLKELELGLQQRSRWSGPAIIASYYAELGDADRAFRYLFLSYAEREEMMLYLKVEPGYESLRGDPRFADLLRRVGLPP
jgi:tetratricopeptide (TPR) repeat protein